ncbi:MAG: hypothetical protein JWQ73_1618 [Variovorax sp.]|jgi:hypothetical protein|nr:hypothetical protein [Variovorax sp.]
MQSVDQLLARALSVVGDGRPGHEPIVYCDGKGGFDPAAASPAQDFDVAAKLASASAEARAQWQHIASQADIDLNQPGLTLPGCDCSGFVCWALGFTRQPAPNVWINTDSIWADANGHATRFRKLARAVPGCLVVYPKPRKEKFGHVGIVTAVDAGGEARTIVHCSAKNFMAAPFESILNNDTDAFRLQPLSIYAWSRDVQGPPSA